MTKIIVDDREPINHPTIVNDLKRAVGDHMVEVKRMPFGDYAFTTNHLVNHQPLTLGIELCSVTDLIEKINSGRLAFQLGNMVQIYDIVYLLVETMPQCGVDGYVRMPKGVLACEWDRYMHVMNAAQAHGVKVIYGRGRGHVGDQIAQLYRYWARDPESHKFFRPVPVLREYSIPLGESLDSRILTLMSIPGVGEDRARTALLSLGSLMAVFLAGEDELKKLPGWGPKTARNLWQFITRTTSQTVDDLMGSPEV